MQHLEVSKLQQLKMLNGQRLMQKLLSSSWWQVLTPSASSLTHHSRQKADLLLSAWRLDKKAKETKISGKMGEKTELL